MALDPLLLDILACPEDKGPLYYFEDEASLFNPRLARRYRIDKGIPVMLIDEAEALDTDETQRLNNRIESDGIRPTFAG
ncbi:MAG: Trm112 family protein [Actinomycetota bacterium]|nr:Trm112 family protein [Actinomycetota bacterium]